MKAEDRKKGTVSFSTYLRYCKAAGGEWTLNYSRKSHRQYYQYFMKQSVNHVSLT